MAEQKFDKEVSWGMKKEDFQAEGEIMVTITLHEYRKLVEGNTRVEQHIAEIKNDCNKQQEQLRAEIKLLKCQLEERMEDECCSCGCNSGEDRDAFVF